MKESRIIKNKNSKNRTILFNKIIRIKFNHKEILIILINNNNNNIIYLKNNKMKDII
jgi:hypothetical protein